MMSTATDETEILEKKDAVCTFDFVTVTEERQQDLNSPSTANATFHLVPQHADCTLHTAPHQCCCVHNVIAALQQEDTAGMVAHSYGHDERPEHWISAIRVSAMPFIPFSFLIPLKFVKLCKQHEKRSQVFRLDTIQVHLQYARTLVAVILQSSPELLQDLFEDLETRVWFELVQH
ncbi:hypothetical protein EYF80_017125 [Liparis tanakae]|uniref:Uncharacterized protein n=1 Tax=Liparis tanakae TaxID=230148 RepID=A0A4Z2I3M5_9TELE|nr:hypothetical protein EYF80_017125 [Liparis tanakae]